MSPPSSFGRIINPEWTHYESQSDVVVIPKGRYGSAPRQKECQLYLRHVASRVREALEDTPVVAINGPRQSGKTTLVREIAGDGAAYLTLDDITLLAAARSDPVGFLRGIDRAVIDEIQRAPDLMLAIKQMVDEDRRPGRFLITGSANLLTLSTIRESLAGRIEVLPLLPLSQSEIRGRRQNFIDVAFRGKPPSVPRAIVGDELVDTVLAGGYPEVLARSNARRRRDWYRSYIAAIVERDVADVAEIGRSGDLPKLLELAAQFAGQLVNLSEIGGSIGLDHKTVNRYLGILEQLFLLRRLRPWFRNELKRLVKTPKLHFIDSGLLGAQRGVTVARVANDRSCFGAILESFVFSELLKQAAWAKDHVAFYHYRDKDQLEVDLVLENDAGDVVGIEVKAAATATVADFRGLQRLAEATGDRFRLGVVLYDHDITVPFGDRLYAAPVAGLWA